jgi:hypothetical protein
MAIRKFVFLDPTTGQYKEQTTVDSINVEAGTDVKSAVNLGQLNDATANLQSEIDAEIARAEAAEAQLASDLAAEVSRAQAAEAAIASDLSAEIARATAAEQGLASDLASEIARAQAAEAAEAAARAAAVSAEQTRAEAAEAGLAADLATEVSNRTAAVAAEAAARAAAVSAEQARAEAAEADLQSQLDSEISARIAAVSAEAAARAAAVSAEEARATAAEADLQSQLDAETAARIAGDNAEAAARAAAVSAEQTRAEAAEAGLAADLATEVSERIAAVSAEQARAEAAEGALAGRLDILEGPDTTVNSVRYLIKNAQSTLQSELDAEIARAEAAEAAIAADLAAEVTRAEGAEATLTADLAAEVSRAEAAEAGLASDIAAEASARAAADSAITSSLNSEISRAQAAESAIAADLASEISRATAAEAAIAADLATETAARIAGDASTLTDAKAYADGLVAGLTFKDAVLYAFPVELTDGGTTYHFPADGGLLISGANLNAGDRILLTSVSETSGSTDAGIYVVNSDKTALVRASDMALGSSAAGAYVYVELAAPGGFASADPGTSFVCSNVKGSDVVGTAALKWAIYSRAENLTFLPEHGLQKSGLDVSVVVKSTGAVTLTNDGLALKIKDFAHLDTDADGLFMTGALVDGTNADGEHKHAVVTAHMGWSSTSGSFHKADGSVASWNAPACFGRGTGSSDVVIYGVVGASAASFATDDMLYLNGSGDGFVDFAGVPSGKYAIPVGKKLPGNFMLVQIGAPVLKA